MPFIGKQQASGFTSFQKKDLTPDGSTTAFTLDKPVASPNDVEVFVGNVRQEPTDAYTVSGTTLTMTAAPASGVNFYVLHKEATQSTTVPAAGTTVPGDFNVQDDFSVDTNTFVVDATNNRVGIGESSPSHLLDLQLPAATNGPMIKMSRAAGAYNMFIGVTSDSDMAIYDNSETERLRFMNQGGISFDSGSNYLDDYEEGDWTPTITRTTTNPTVTYSRQHGMYVKVGSMVSCHFNIYATSLSGGSGNVQVGGFPFQSTNTQGNGSEARRPALTLAFATGTGWSSATPRTGLMKANSTEAVLYTSASSDVRANFGTALATLPSTINIYGSITYFSDA